MTQASSTSGSTWPNISRISWVLVSSTAAEITTEQSTEAVNSWLAAIPARSCSCLPMYWLMTTAPPEARAVNRLMKMVLKALTSDTPDTAASPT